MGDGAVWGVYERTSWLVAAVAAETVTYALRYTAYIWPICSAMSSPSSWMMHMASTQRYRRPMPRVTTMASWMVCGRV